MEWKCITSAHQMSQFEQRAKERSFKNQGNQQQNLLLSFNTIHGDQAIKKSTACNWYS
jgi:hypothetical protein